MVATDKSPATVAVKTGRRAMEGSPATRHPSVSAALIYNAGNEIIAADFVPQ
jgi:hypothetical protein